MATIHESVESARGCGYRKSGGIYLVAGRIWHACGKLPIELTTCPCCNQGIKFTRGFSWIAKKLIDSAICKKGSACINCLPWSDETIERLGLLSVGEKSYPRPSDFIKEIGVSGLSKRISQVPKDLVLGETWVMLAHKKCIAVYYDEGGKHLEEPIYKLGIFGAFIPEAIEYILTGEETDEELEALEKRGFRLVKVIRDVDVEGDAQLTIDKQLEEFEVRYYKPGEKSLLTELVKAISEKAARQSFKKKMEGVGIHGTRIMSCEKS